MSDKSAQVSALDDFELEDIAHSALQEGLSFGVNLDVFMRFAKRIASAALAQQPAPAAVPDGWKLVPVEMTPEMVDVALKWGTKRSEWAELLAAAPAAPAPSERPTDAMLDDMRKRGLSIDGDNSYKRDLIDCIIGTLILGKQGGNPPPAGHWAQQFWEMAREEREIQGGIAESAAQDRDTLNRICELFRIGENVRTPSAILTNVGNAKRFADMLNAIELEFLMVPGEPDEDFPDDEPQPECLVSGWGSTVEQYVEQFRSALARIATTAPAPAAQEPVAWIIVDEPFHGTGGVEAGEWDVEFERKAIDTMAAANSPGRIALYTAPPAAEQPSSCQQCAGTGYDCPDCIAAVEQPDSARSILTDEDMRRLRRFQEICEDSDACGHDLPKEAVKRLELAGALRSCGFGRHEVTLFGDYLLGKESEA